MGALQKDAFSAEEALKEFMYKCGEDGVEEEVKEMLEPIFKFIRLAYMDNSYV